MEFPGYRLQTEASKLEAPVGLEQQAMNPSYATGAKPVMSRRPIAVALLLCAAIYAVVGSVAWLVFHQ